MRKRIFDVFPEDATEPPNGNEQAAPRKTLLFNMHLRPGCEQINCFVRLAASRLRVLKLRNEA